MLLYVDKKKQKRQKIKRIIAVLACFFVLYANVTTFHSLQHAAQRHLFDYQPITNINQFGARQDVVGVFTAKGENAAKIIVVPEILSRQNLVTIAMVIARFMQTAQEVYFTQEVPEQEYLFRFIRLFFPDINLSKTRTGVVVTTRLDNVEDIVKQGGFYPRFFYYNYAKKHVDLGILASLIDEKFPLPEVPVDSLAKEKAALTEFADLYHAELVALLAGKEEVPFSVQYFMLQHVNVCAISGEKFFCQLNENVSLQKNLQFWADKMDGKEWIDKLVLLTSLQEVSPGDVLDADDGVIFRYGKREEIMLPVEKKDIDNVYARLKVKMGVNPDYFDADMKFYRFKIVEVNFNDSI